MSEARLRRSAMLGLVTLFAVLLAVVTVRAAVTPLGSAAPADQACLQAMSGPALSEPDYALLRRTHVVQTWLPLGIICSVDADKLGSSVIAKRYQSWGLTSVAADALGIAAVASALLLGSRRLS